MINELRGPAVLLSNVLLYSFLNPFEADAGAATAYVADRLIVTLSERIEIEGVPLHYEGTGECVAGLQACLFRCFHLKAGIAKVADRADAVGLPDEA